MTIFYISICVQVHIINIFISVIIKICKIYNLKLYFKKSMKLASKEHHIFKNNMKCHSVYLICSKTIFQMRPSEFLLFSHDLSSKKDKAESL